MKADSEYILASNSPRRKELFGLISSDFAVIPSNVPEIVPDGMEVCKRPEYLARLKALDIAEKYPQNTVLGADTLVIIGDEILGKPKDRADAERMLRLLSGNVHKVITGCAVVKNGECRSFSVITEVEFYSLTDTQIEEYINTSEPYDKAGGYGIQAQGSLFVKQIKGDYNNVVGLPVAELNRKLKETDF